MENPNALIAMAHVTENANNPYFAFCEFIKYCMMKSTDDDFTVQSIRDAVKKEFGIKIPHHVVMKCFGYLREDEYISFMDNHIIRRVGSFDVATFDEARDAFRKTETALITALIEYVKKYGKEWTEEYARDQLVSILRTDNLAYDVFFHDYSSVHGKTSDSLLLDGECERNDESSVDSEPLFPDIAYVGKFILDTINNESPIKEYLEKISEGLMVCVGTYQLPSNGSETTRPFIKGTTFAFDTRLLLRFIGCAGDAATEAAQDLVSYIQENGGTICYYPHTFQEMYDALDYAKKQLDRGDLPHDRDMLLFSKKVNHSSSVFAAKRENLKQELARAHIYKRELQSYTDKELIKYGFSLDTLINYMGENTNWDRVTISNDARSIWETHMSRAGNYESYYGTRDRLSVFVTTNSMLITLALGYKNEHQTNPALSNWKPNRLPVITDGRLTCRLWTPATGNNLPLLRLAANAVAAQQPTRTYYEKVKVLVSQLKAQVPEYSQIPLSEFFDDELSDTILKKTEGCEESFDLGALASSLSEYVELRTIDQSKVVNEVKTQCDEYSNELERQKQSIVDGAVTQWANKMGIYGIYLNVILNWNFICAPLIAAINAYLGTLLNSQSFFYITCLIVILTLCEKFSSSRYVARILLRLFLPSIIEKNMQHILKSLRPIELEYKDEILNRIFDETVLLQRCIKITGNDIR